MSPPYVSDIARRRRRRRRAFVLIAALGLGVALSVALLAWGFGAEGLRARLEAATAAATGLDIRIGRLTVSFFPPRAVLEEITIASGGRTVATADAARAAFTWGDLLRPGPLTIAALDIEGPEIWLDLDAGLARSAPADGAGAGASIRIGPTRVRGGALTLSRSAGDLSLVVRDVDLALTSLAGDAPLTGVIEQARADLAIAGKQISGLAVRGELGASDGIWRWRNAALTWEETGTCDTEGTFAPTDVALVATVRCDVDSRRVAQQLGLPEERRPAGRVTFAGTVRHDTAGAALDGRLAAATLAWFGVPLSSASTNVRASPESITLETLAAGIADGRLAAELVVSAGAGGWTVKGAGTLTDVDPERLPLPEAVRAGLPPLATRADLEARLELPLADPTRLSGDWTMELRPTPAARGALAMAGQLSGHLDAGVLRLAPSRIETIAAALDVSGTADRDGRLDLDIHLEAEDLGVTTVRLAEIWPVLEPWRVTDTSGSLEFEGTVEGTLAAPAVTGIALAEGLTLSGLPVGTVSAHLSTDGRELFLDQVDVNGPLARLTFTGSGPLARPADLRGAWTAEWIDAGVLAAATGRPGLVDGLVGGAGELEPGPELTARLTGSNLRVAGVPIDRLTAAGRVDRRMVTLDTLRLEQGTTAAATAAGALPWRAASPPADGIAVHVDRFPIDGLAGRTDLRGLLSLDVRIGGSMAHPRPLTAATWSLAGFGWRQAGPVDLAGDAQLEGADIVMTAAGPEESWTGTARFDTATADGLVIGELRIANLNLDVSEAARAAGAQARVAGAVVQFEGPWRNPALLRLGVDVTQLSIAAEDWLIENRTPIHLFGEGGLLSLAEVTFAVSDQEVRVRGDIDVNEPMRLDLDLEGAADVRTLAPLLPGTTLGGTATFNLGIEGPLDALRTTGDVELRNGYLRLAGFPQPFQRVAAQAEIDGGRLRLTRLQADLGGGTVDAVGEATVRGLTLERFAFDIEGRGVALRLPEHLATLSDLHLHLEGTPAQSRLSGEVELARARYTADLRLDRALFTPPPRPIEGFAPPGLLDRVRLDLMVFAPGQIWLDNDLGRAEFRADLEVGGTAGHPVLAGTVDAVRGGRLRFREVDYTLLGAHLVFSPDAPNDPEIEADAETRLQPYDVTVTVSGRASAPRLDLATTPELPREQVVSLLLSGGRWRPDEPAGPGTRGDEFALQGQIGATSSVAENLGLDIVRLDPVLSAEQADPTARVTLGGWVSRRLFASYSFLLGDSGGDAVELRYRLLENFEMRAAREGDGTNVAEGRFLRSFDTMPRATRAEAAGARLTTPVTLAGVPDPPGTATVLRALGLTPGSSLERGRVLLATRRAEERLAEAGYPRARLDCRTSATTMDCDVLAGPFVELEIDGARGVKDRRAVRDAVWRVWQELVDDEDFAPEAVDAARRVLRDRGYAGAEAAAEVEAVPADEGAPPRRLVTLHLTPGPRIRVHRVAIDGLTALTQKQAKDALLAARRDGLRHPLLTPNLLADDTNALLRLAFGAGCLEARVEPPVVTTPEAPDEALVTFTVHEGPRYRLESVAFAGLSLLDEEALRTRLGLPPGSFIDPARLDAFARELRTDYDNLGFPDAAVAWRLERGGPERAVAVFDVAEGPFARIGAIRIEGYRRTNEEVIRRELTLRPGDPLRHDDLARSRRRLGQLGIFRSIVLRPDPASVGQSVRDVLVRVDEKDNLDISFGAGFDNEEGGRLSAGLGLRNLGGTSASVSLQARWGELDRLGQLLTGWRHVRGSRYDTLGSLLVRTEQRPSFTVHRRQVSAQLARAVVEGRSTVQYRYRIQDVRLTDLQVPEADTGFTDGLLAGLGTSFARSTRDDLLDPHTGGLRTADLEVNANALGSDSNYLRLVLHEAQHFTFGPRRLVFGIAGRAGAAWVFDDTLVVPLSERFFAGGVASVRGFEKDFLGPVDPISGKPTGGEALLVVNAEARLPLSERLTGIWFLDGGNVFPKPSDFDPFDLRFATGPGLAIGTPVGPLQFFFGWKIDPLDGEDRWEFHFTFGPTF